DGSGQLMAALNTYLAATSTEQRDSSLNALLYRWVGAENLASASRGGMNASQIAVMEAVFGEQYRQETPFYNDGLDPGPMASSVLSR
ncbi:MAG: hypothetical protein ACK5OA_13280, partial [Acidovorax sp.]